MGALNLAIVADDEPVAVAPERPSADRFDSREINRKAVKHWSTLQHMLFDQRGWPLRDVARLSPNYVETDPGRARPHNSPRLSELRGLAHHNDGSWVCLSGNLGSGDDVISLVQALAGGGCDRRVAADFLKSLCDRMVVLP